MESGKKNLVIRSVQSSIIRTLFEVIKECLADINIVITSDSFKITEMDSKKTSLVHLNLEAANFEDFKCEKTLVLGINSQNVFRLIKNAKNDDTITFFMYENSETKLWISLENATTNRKTTFDINLMNIPYKKFSIPSIEFDSEISLPSAEFNNYCKMMNSLHMNEMEIESLDQQITFKGIGPNGGVKVELGKSNNIFFDKTKKEVIQGRFSVAYLMLFSKAQNLSRTVSFFFSNDYPLVLSFKVGTLGTLKYVVRPLTVDTE